MARLPEFAGRVLLSTALGGACSVAALAAAARLRGKGALQPLNAVSHWRHGEAAAAVTHADWRHTGTGAATHAAATLFWALSFEWWLGRRRTTMEAALRASLLVSGIAAVVDYTATPKRFTPGWEFVLPPAWMSSAYAGMAAGFFAAARLTRGTTGDRGGRGG